MRTFQEIIFFRVEPRISPPLEDKPHRVNLDSLGQPVELWTLLFLSERSSCVSILFATPR
jgi:hypothetical protein